MIEEQLKNFENAKKSYEDQNFAKATEILLRLYDEVDSHNVVKLLGDSLYAQQKYDEANRLIDDNFNFYVNNDFTFLMNNYLKTNRFIELRIILNNINDENENKFKKIETAEANYRGDKNSEFEMQTRQFQHLGAFSTTEQKEVIRKSETLPFSEYLKAVKNNLLDKDVNPVWRVQLLNNLMRLGYGEKTNFIWINGKEYQVIPSKMVDVEETDAYQDMINLLNNMYAQSNPIKYAQLEMFIKVDLQNLFPYIDKTIDDPQAWLTEIKNKAMGDTSKDNSKAQSNAKEWLSLIDKLLLSLAN